MAILEVKNLTVGFGEFRAVSDVSLEIREGEVFGLVGESGSGKTMTALSIPRLIPRQSRIEGGRILFRGEDTLAMTEGALRAIRGARIAFVFQEPRRLSTPSSL